MRRQQTLKWPKTKPSTGFRGLYVNLDRAVARRRRVEADLRRLGLADSYMRLPAIDGKRLKHVKGDAAVEGCFRSHAAAIDLARAARMPVHILEDDVLVTAHVQPFIAHALQTALLDRYDLLFLDMWVDPQWDRIRRLNDLCSGTTDRKPVDYAGLAVVDMKEFRLGSLASYLLNPRGATKVGAHLQAEIERGIGMAVDLFIGARIAAGDITVGVVVPFLTGNDIEQAAISDIQVLGEDELRLFVLLRSAFFIDADLSADILPQLEIFAATGRYEGLDLIARLVAKRAAAAGS